MEREMPENSVVVNLNQYDRSRRVQASAETLPVLHDCRDLLIESVARVLTRQSEAMENTLLAMADRSPLLETRNTYYSAQRVLSKRTNELLSACKEAYCLSFNGVAHNRERSGNAGLLELSLVNDQDFEITLVVDKATSRLRYNCAEELVALDARIGHLLGRPDLSENDNPLGPRALCEALLDGLTRMQLEQDIQIVLLNQFDLILTTELARIYQSINLHLMDRGILPDIKVGAKNRSHGTGQNGAATASSVMSSQTGSDIFKLFEQLAGSSGTTGASGGTTGRMAGFSLLDSLGQLQTGAMMLPEGGRLELPLLEAATIQNVLRNLQHSTVMQSASPLDAVLVDAVAMLFDVVFDESGIPDRLKAQIARLQIPVLKAAMLDRNFFSQSNHPVRRMLDAIATLAVHLPENAAGNARLEAISDIVSRVLETFEKDIAVFEAATAELDAMDSLLEGALDETVEASLQQDIARIKQSERTELAPVIVHDFISRALKDQPVVDAIREFLQRDWAQLLTGDYISEGEQGAHFNSHVETMRELIWSVQPKADMDTRLMLVRILPGLLKRLREGVAEIDLPQKVCDHFFATLVILHANAVRPNAQPVPLPDITPEEIEALELVPSTPAARTIPLAPDVEDEFTEHARALNKGDWVEFHYDDGTFRWARLGWASNIKNTYLFSDQDGMNSFSISQQRLADKLRRGEAVLVERKSITESAFGKLLNLFREKLGRA